MESLFTAFTFFILEMVVGLFFGFIGYTLGRFFWEKKEENNLKNQTVKITRRVRI